MKAPLLYLLIFCIISCNNEWKPGPAEYSKNDLEFIKKADNICRTIDAENHVERTKTGTHTDVDGQQYPAKYYGYAKSPSDSIDKFFMTMAISDTERMETTFYYYNGATIKCLAEAFGQDTLSIAYYYDEDKVISRKDVKRETGEGFLNEAIYWRTNFPPTDSTQLKAY
jgi:hypothetical protein